MDAPTGKDIEEGDLPQFNDITPPFVLPDPVAAMVALNPSFGGGLNQRIQIGAGNTVFNVDFSGMWMGDRRFIKAPFRVNMKGEAIMRLLDLSGARFVDENGLISLANFSFTDKIKSLDQQITDTPWVTVGGLTHIITLTRAAKALFLVSLAGYHEDAGGRLEFQLTLNSVPIGGIFCLNQVATATAVQTTMGFVFASLTIGENDLGIQARSSNANSGWVKGTVIPSVSSVLLLGR